MKMLWLCALRDLIFLHLFSLWSVSFGGEMIVLRITDRGWYCGGASRAIF